MAIEKVKVAAKAAQPKEISTGRSIKRADCTESRRGDCAEWRNWYELTVDQLSSQPRDSRQHHAGAGPVSEFQGGGAQR